MIRSLLRGTLPVQTNADQVLPGAFNRLPDQATLSTPANSASVADDAFSPTWSAARRAISYEIQYADDSAFVTNPVTTAVAGLTTTFDPVLAAGTYYWRVRGISSYGPGPWSAARTVTITHAG